MAKRRKKKLTVNQQLFKQESARIKRAMRRLERRGYIFNQQVIPDKPKRISQKLLRKMRTITTDELYNLAQYVDRETGDAISGFERRTQERKERTKKAADTRRRRKKEKLESEISWVDEAFSEAVKKDPEGYAKRVIESYQQNYRKFNKDAVRVLDKFMETLLNNPDSSIMEVAEQLEKAMASGNLLTYKEAYSADQMADYLERMIEYFDFGPLGKMELIDSFYYDEDWRL